MTNAKLTERLEELRKESLEGGKIKQALTRKLANIDTTLLRISGAMQVLWMNYGRRIRRLMG